MSDEALRKHMALQQANQHNHKQPSKPVQDNTNPAALNVMDELFTRLKAISAVGSAFKTESEEKIVKQEWMLAFKEEGIVKQSMIDDGVELFRVKARKNRGTTWFPSIGGFVDLCVGSEDKQALAERAYNLFIKRESQIDTVGKMVTAGHAFDLRKMEASKSKKAFIELYLEFAQNNPIEPLEAFALTDGVQLTKEQQKDRENRTEGAKNEFFDKFNAFTVKNPSIPAEAVTKALEETHGIKQGSLKQYAKTPKQLEDEKKRQLAAIANKL